VPGPRGDIEQTRRRGVGELSLPDTGEPVGDQVRDQQQARRGVQQALVPIDRQLVERVERQELQAVGGVQFRRRNHLADRLDALRGALVPVVERRADDTVTAQQGVVDGPGVDADADQVRLGRHRLAQPFENVAVELKNVPVQPVPGPNRHVRKAVHVLDLKPAGADPAEDDASAGRAEIHGCNDAADHLDHG
jgi:hypothetical protein